MSQGLRGSLARLLARLALVLATCSYLTLLVGCPPGSRRGAPGAEEESAFRERILLTPTPVVLAEGGSAIVEFGFQSDRPGLRFSDPRVVNPRGNLEVRVDTARETTVTPFLRDLVFRALDGSAGIHEISIEAGHSSEKIVRTITVVVVPRDLAFLPGAISISGGDFHSLAILEGGSVVAWGRNDRGQLGDGSQIDRPFPVPVTGLPGPAVSVAAGGAHSVALLADGTVWSWGANDRRQLGAADTLDGRDSSTPAPLACRDFRCNDGLPRFTAIAAGGEHSLALTNTGVVWSWGKAIFGQLGRQRLGRETGIAFPIAFPNSLEGIVNFVAIACGEEFSLALEDDGRVWGWGDNRLGQLGDRFEREYEFPIEILGLGPASAMAIAAGSDHAMVLSPDGTVRTAGSNAFGQLGEAERAQPGFQRVGNLFDVVAIDGGFGHSLALRANGTAMAWGLNAFDQLGFPEIEPPNNVATPVLVQAVPALRAIASGGRHSLAIARDCPHVWSWGDNVVGQLGNGVILRNGFPVRTHAIGDRAGGTEELACDVPLTVGISGEGTVNSIEGEIACPDGRCSDTYERQSTVTLNATAREGHVFIAWEGDALGTEPTVSVLMSDSRNVVARFEPVLQPPEASFTFTPLEPVQRERVLFDASASVDPDGEILSHTWSSPDDLFLEGEGVSFAYEFAFLGPHRVVLTVTDDQGLVATTERSVTVGIGSPPPPPPPGETFLLEIVFVGSGTGRVTLADGELSCEANCSFRLNANDTFRIVASANEGSFFSHFVGCDSVEGMPFPNECVLTLDRDRRIEVFFE